MTNLKINSGTADLLHSGRGRVYELRTVQEKPAERLKWFAQNRCHLNRLCHTARPGSRPHPVAGPAGGNLTAVQGQPPQMPGFQTHGNLGAAWICLYRSWASTPISHKPCFKAEAEVGPLTPLCLYLEQMTTLPTSEKINQATPFPSQWKRCLFWPKTSPLTHALLTILFVPTRTLLHQLLPFSSMASTPPSP